MSKFGKEKQQNQYLALKIAAFHDGSQQAAAGDLAIGWRQNGEKLILGNYGKMDTNLKMPSA